jgi:ribosomal protein S18 acetylase RimI-like enzyme
MEHNEIRILEYLPCHQEFFERLNRSWIEKHFRREPVDRFILSDPQKAVLDMGGAILIATWNGTPAGTVALKKIDPDTFEFAKMAVEESLRGKGIGEALARRAIMKARSLGAQKVVLYSHSTLKPALQLYRKIGFRDIPKEAGIFAHCDVKMELRLDDLSVSIAAHEDAEIIASIGRRSFQDAFAGFFHIQTEFHQYLEYTYDSQKITASLVKPNNVFFLCRFKGVPAGFAKLKLQSLNSKITGRRQSELQKLYVLGTYQGSGVADALMKEVKEKVAQVRPENLWLDVLVQNTRAIRFYQKHGFARQDQHFFTIGTQLFEYHIMTLSVEPLHQGQEHIAKTIGYGNP